MNVGICRKVLLSLLLCGLITGQAQAVSVSGRSSTEIEWFDTAAGDTVVAAFQYLRLQARDLGAEGYNFYLYGRLSGELTDVNEFDRYTDSRLYTAYLNKREMFKDLDVRLGRQFFASAAGASIMDGIHLDYRGFGKVTVSVFGGGDVAYYHGYSAEDLIDGIELRATPFDGLDLSLGYLQKWLDGDLSKEMIGFSADYDWRDRFSLYIDSQFDYLSNSLSYFLGGAKYHGSPNWTIKGEYLYSLPVFSATSIYSVFAVNEYQEALAELTYRIGVGLNAYLRYSREMYLDYDDADVVELGIEKIRTKRFSGYLSGTWRSAGDGQDLKGVKAYAAYMLDQKIKAGLGVHIDVLERRLEVDSDDTTSSRVWIDGTYYLSKRIDLQAKVERIESDLWNEYYQGRVRLNIGF